MSYLHTSVLPVHTVLEASQEDAKQEWIGSFRDNSPVMCITKPEDKPTGQWEKINKASL